MKRRNKLTLLITISITLALFLSVQNAAAANRKELLEQFCLSNQHSSGAFLDTPTGNVEDEGLLSEFTTYANLFILAQIDPELTNLNDQGIIRSYLRDRYLQFSDVGSGIITQAYYAYFGGILLDTNFTSTMIEDATTKLFELQNDTTNGFASAEATEANIPDTYFAVKLLTTFGKINETSPTNLANFVFSTWDAENSAFASIPGGEATIIDTYYALATLSELNSLNQLNSTQIQGISDFVESYYFGDPTQSLHYGGYGIQTGITQSSLLLTYFATHILSLLDIPLHEETLTWVLSRQNPTDYGFADVSSGNAELISSAKLSYYAVSTILLYDSEAFSTSRNALMNEEIWQLETNPWAITGIVIGSIATVALIIFGIYKYRNRI
ncbi:MAG: prenyltransferase/squalene oxidase repeat-containing protein [Promethearchaeota archaeon]